MEKIVFECETITPMFMYGADGTTPELRPASIKGVMRFWWRAIHGENSEYENFGTTEKKSSFSIKIQKYQGIPKNFKIELIVSSRCTIDIVNFFKLVVLLGGFGKSAKKIDSGKMKIVKIDEDDYSFDITLLNILSLLNQFDEKFKIDNDKIIDKKGFEIWIDDHILNTKINGKIFQRKING